MSDRPVRPGTQRPVRTTGGTMATARRPRATALMTSPSPASTRPRQARRTAATDNLSLLQIASGVLVAMVVIATLWSERNQPDPVAGFGVLDARGVAVATSEEGVMVGQPAPDFRLPATDNEVVALDDVAGQPVVLQFWTSWCLDCVDAIPVFQQVANALVDTVTVLGIAPEETASRVDGALNRAGATYTTLLDENGSVTARYGASTLPFTVVIDANGQIVAVHQGRLSAAEIEADLAPLLP